MIDRDRIKIGEKNDRKMIGRRIDKNSSSVPLTFLNTFLSRSKKKRVKKIDRSSIF